MKLATHLIVGTCLMFQPWTLAGSSEPTTDMEQAVADVGTAPALHKRQARELLGLSAFDGEANTKARSMEMSLYINKKVKQLLPEPWRPKSWRIAQALIETANQYQMDPVFLMAVARHESRFNPAAIGSHGEIGLMQIKPTTAMMYLGHGKLANLSDQDVEKVLRDPISNIRLGAAHLNDLRRTFKGRGALFLTAYNMGTLKARGHLREGRLPRIYADKVLAQYMELTAGLSSRNFQERSIARLDSTKVIR